MFDKNTKPHKIRFCASRFDLGRVLGAVKNSTVKVVFPIWLVLELPSL